MKPITILIADDHRVVRREFRRILEREADLKVVGEAKNGLEAVALTKKLRPAIVLMDVVMPRLNGLQATRQILATVPATKVLMFSAHRDDVYVEEAIHAGARGYVIKQSSIDTLGAAIREVHMGNPYFSPEIPQRLRKQARTRAARH